MDGVDTLIVQWDRRSYFFQSGTGTFQVQLFGRLPVPTTSWLPVMFIKMSILTTYFMTAERRRRSGCKSIRIPPRWSATVRHRLPTVMSSSFYVASGDRYQIDMVAGETITLQSSTPLDDPSDSLVNTLDPAIAVMDASGGVLATDANSLDGKNALLTFTAPLTGTYIVSIFAESGSGDYVLNKSTGAPTLDGDFNNDGVYDHIDIDLLTTAISGGGPVPQFDLSGDGQLSIDDVDRWLAEAGNVNLGSGVAYLPGDANLDGVVDGLDFSAWNSHKFTPHTHWSGGDFNTDGVVDGRDFTVWNAHKFTSSTAMPRVPRDPRSAHLGRRSPAPTAVRR